MTDNEMRTIERAAQADPADQAAQDALAVARVRAGAPYALVSVDRRPVTPGRDGAAATRRNTVVYVDVVGQGDATASAKTTRLVSPAIREALGLGSAVRVLFSKNAGCSSCPCSPGFIIRSAGLMKPEDVRIRLVVAATLPTEEPMAPGPARPVLPTVENDAWVAQEVGKVTAENARARCAAYSRDAESLAPNNARQLAVVTEILRRFPDAGRFATEVA